MLNISSKRISDKLDQARRTAAACLLDDPKRLAKLTQLEDLLWKRFEDTRRCSQTLLEECIKVERQICDLCPTGHPDRADSCRDLATSLYARFEQLGDESLLDEAISLEREALSLTPTHHPCRAASCRNLAVSLHTRLKQLGDESLLDEAVSLEREALSLTPCGHPDRASSCRVLAVSLHTRFVQLGDQSLLNEAISLFREALSLTPRGHPDRALSCRSLAIPLHTRVAQLGDDSLFDEIISLEREALSLMCSGHPDRALSCRVLATSLHLRFQHFGDKLLLDEAISLKREALSLTPRDHPDRALSCRQLAASLHIRFKVLGDESTLYESFSFYDESIQLRPPHHPQQWRALTELSRMHLDEQTPIYNRSLAIDYLCRAISLNADNLPIYLSRIGGIASEINPSNLPLCSLRKFLQCFSALLDASSLVVGFILDHQSQLKYLSSCRTVGPSAYLCAALCGQKEFGLELLEHARGMFWSQLLHIRDPQFEGIPLDMASELQQLLRDISASKSIGTSALATTADHAFYLTPHDVRYQQNTRINQLVREIRDLPGHKMFMRGLPFRHLALSTANHTVVVLVAGQEECRALILQSKQGELEDIRLEQVTATDLTQLSVTLLMPRMRGTTPTGTEADSRGMQVSCPREHLYRVFYKLWNAVVKPVLDHLHLEKSQGHARPRLHWCPTGPFTFLPLHAAGNYDKGKEECCSDYIVSSYTPTLAALLRAQRSWPVIVTEASRLALVAALKARDSMLPILYSVQEEMNDVVSVARQARISVDESCLQDSATLAYTASSLQASTMAHIACHGTQNPANALLSGFCLQDGQLTVSQLIELDLKNAFFAFLSACETAKGDKDQPDQTVHLAAAMLFVGFRSVVATLWAMGDEDGPKLAKFFYKRLFAADRILLDDIPYALDYAVGQLRMSGVPPERWATFIHMGA